LSNTHAEQDKLDILILQVDVWVVAGSDKCAWSSTSEHVGLEQKSDLNAITLPVNLIRIMIPELRYDIREHGQIAHALPCFLTREVEFLAKICSDL
jgi:hypothetical protein